MKHSFGIPAAAACIRGDGGICGEVTFFAQRNGTLVAADIRGLPDSDTGFFAWHIHEGGDCRGSGFSDTGSHFNPRRQPHPRHAGDLPPLLSCGGKAHMAVVTERFRVQDVIGRTVVIHSQPDDFRTQPAGNSGKKIACGVICRT